MPYNQLKKQIKEHCFLSDSELELVLSKFKPNRFRQNEYLLFQGSTSRDLHFIVDGLVRVYYIKEDKEITTYLTCDNGFVASYSSFINQTASLESIQCIEATETLSISFKELHELYTTIPSLEKIGRILAEQNVLCLADRLVKIHSLSAKEKYLEFLKTAPPKIVQRTPLLHIASYLGIAPESLSRIRKSIS